jgi:hypothetical protein
MADQQIERLNSAIGASIELIRYVAATREKAKNDKKKKRTKLRQTETTLLAIVDASDIKAHVEAANQLKTVQTLLAAFSTGDAVPPKVEQLTADELQSKAGEQTRFFAAGVSHFLTSSQVGSRRSSDRCRSRCGRSPPSSMRSRRAATCP